MNEQFTNTRGSVSSELLDSMFAPDAGIEVRRTSGSGH
jgi:hypothetical protein